MTHLTSDRSFDLSFSLASVSDTGIHGAVGECCSFAEGTRGLQRASDDLKVWCMWLSDSSWFSSVLWPEKEIKVCFNHADQPEPGMPSLWSVSLLVYTHSFL